MTASGDSAKILNNLRVNDLSRGGNGVARDGRRVIFLPFTMKDDVVTARIISEDKRFATAEVVEIVEPSPDRVSPRCSVFGKCGGCTWQHVPYGQQWQTKRDGVHNALSRASVTLEGVPLQEFPATNPWNYRNRIQLRAEAGTLGYYARGSKDLVNIERCEIAREELNSLLPGLRLEAEERAKRLESTKSGDVAPELKVEVEVLPDGSVRKVWNERHGSLGFRQVNDEQNEKLRKYVREALTDDAHVFDLYGGSGNFTYADADRYARVECVDLGSPEGGLPDQPENFRFYKSDVGRWLDRRGKDFERGVFSPKGQIEVILDPPREGMGAYSDRIGDILLHLDATKIIAIGCDADAWGRDLSRFIAAGWKLSSAAVFDLFPQTPHIESVAILIRDDSSVRF